MRVWPVRLLWSILILFLALFMTYAGRYAYRSVVYRGDNVSFTACPAPLIYGENDGCVAGLQRLLDADLPHAGLRHDGIFGHKTLAATREFQSRHDLPVTGKADPGTLQVLKDLAPEPSSLPVAAILLTASIMATVLLGRKITVAARGSAARLAR
jgi:peptidoglycan hydrolase-like protein with peptidoglycan-binding domain